MMTMICGAGQGALAQRPDTVLVPASLQYRHPGLINRVLLGGNYRRVWQTPVRLPVFHLKEQGFAIKELGGGNQTLSLQLVDRSGKTWVLRTVDKNVERALPPLLRKTFVLNMTQQQVSGAHPYAPLVVAHLARATGINAPDPIFYYVPDDPVLGEFRPLFAGTVCLLEEREPGEPKTQNSEKVMERFVDKGSARPDQESILRARVLDILVGDWDRHSGQWRWADRPKEKEPALVYALPRDRDQAFYYSNGLLPRFMQLVALKYLVSYNADIDHWRSLTFKSWPFDRYFLNGLDRAQWERTLRSMQASLTDSLLEKAVVSMPAEVYPVSGRKLLRQLKGRRDNMVRKGMKYYRFLSGYVNVYGSDADEEFVLSGGGDSVQVRVYRLRAGVRGPLIYDRRFDRSETRLLRIWAMRGNDRFVTEGTGTRFDITLITDDENDDYRLDPDMKVVRKTAAQMAGQ